MKRLSDLPNIGLQLEEKLIQAGIAHEDDLFRYGSKRSFQKISEISPGACLNMLLALEGAVQGLRWHSLHPAVKQELEDYYNSL